MMRTIARLIYSIDQLFHRPRVGGRESPEDYSRWEYRNARELIEQYPRFFEQMKGRLVLDIGCGMGGKTVAYAEEGARPVGVDVVPERVKQGSTFSGERGEGIVFLAGDAENLPFRDEAFDMVIANDSMEHFPRPEKALRELIRVIKPAGLVFLFFTPWHSPLGSHLYDYIHTPWCHLIYPENLIRELLAVHFERKGSGLPEPQADKLIREYRTELNRITVKRYHEILNSMDNIEMVEEELAPPRFSFLSCLTRLPLVGDLFVGTVVGVLRKKGSGRAV